MRGYSDTAKLVNESYVDPHPNGPRAVLRVAGHGTFFGEPRMFVRDALQDLVDLQAKHIPKAASANGFSAKQEADIAEAMRARGVITPEQAKRELGHGLNATEVSQRREESRMAERVDCMQSCHPETCHHSWAR